MLEFFDIMKNCRSVKVVMKVVVDCCLGHFQILGISFSPNGHHLATGSEDNSCRIWDLRKRKSLQIIPAHSHLISQVKYEPQEGYFLTTASYDTTAKVKLFFILLEIN